jgi:ABC-type branched-subunit amino acid transport system ATPase component
VSKHHAVAIENLCVRRRGLDVLRGLDLQVGTGGVVGIFGANGSGKTTLLDTICRSVREIGGDILLSGRSIRRFNTAQAARLGIARSFQVPQIFPNLTTTENLITSAIGPLRSSGLRAVPSDLSMQAFAYLTRCNLRSYADLNAGVLSHGQRRLLDVGCAIARSRRLLLFDEPTAGLAFDAKSLIGELITEQRKNGVSIIVIEHNLPFINQYCDRIYELTDGKLATR